MVFDLLISAEVASLHAVLLISLLFASFHVGLFAHLGFLVIAVAAATAALEGLGPNSKETFWFEFWLEKSLVFWLEIPHTKKMLKNG